MFRSFAFFVVSVFLGTLKQVFAFGRRFRVVRKRNMEIALRAKQEKSIGILIIGNHPSLLEVLGIPLLFFPRFIFDYSLVPISTPDEKNFHDAKLFSKFLRPFVKFFMWIVPSFAIARGNARKSIEALKKISEELEKGNIVLMFPEGGRTGKEHDSQKLRFWNGRKIRKFQSGISVLIKNARKPFIILPLWTEGAEDALPINSKIPKFWKRLFFHFGRPWRVGKEHKTLPREKILDILERSVLEAKK